MGRSTRKNLFGGLVLAWHASRAHFLAIAALVAVTASLPPLEIWLGKHLVDLVTIEHGDPLPTVIALGLAFGADRALGVIRSNVQDVFATHVERHAMQQFLAKAAAIDIGHLDDPTFHDSARRARRDVHWLPSQLTFMSFEIVASSATVLAMIGVLATLHPLLGCLLAVTVLPWITFQRRANRKLFDFLTHVTPQSRERDYMAGLLADPESAKEIRSYGLADHLLGRFVQLRQTEDRQRARLMRRMNLVAAACGLVGAAAVTAGYGFVAERAGTMTPGSLVAVFGAFATVATHAGALAFQLGQLDRHATFLGDYFGFLAMPALVPVPEPPQPLPARLAGIRFEGVHFTYPRGTAPALRGLDLAVEPGELVAIVGENGAGKTTIVNLLSRFYDPTEGRVVVSGLDARTLDPAALRARIGVLLQDFVKYQLPVREAVQVGRIDRPDATDADVTAALAAARAKDLADDLDRRVGKLFDGGHDLSGGQWQRLAIARLIYRQADLWILDEPTSNLDPEAEAAIFAELKQQLAGRMAIVISHRFSTVRVADRIYVVEGGRVLETGTHDDLVARGGRYAALFELQAKGYR